MGDRGGDREALHREPSSTRRKGSGGPVASWLLMKKKGIGMSFTKWKRRFAKKNHIDVMRFDAGVMLLYSDDGPGADLKEKITVTKAMIQPTASNEAGTYTFETRSSSSAGHIWGAFKLEDREMWFEAFEDVGADVQHQEAGGSGAAPAELETSPQQQASGVGRKLPNFSSLDHVPAREWDGHPPEFVSPRVGCVRWAPPFDRVPVPGHDRGPFLLPNGDGDEGAEEPRGLDVVKVVLGEKLFLKTQRATLEEMTSLAATMGEVGFGRHGGGHTHAHNTTTTSNVPLISKGYAAGNQVMQQWLEKGQHLGSGTFGNVYKGTYFSQNVGIKELIVQDLTQEALDEFEHEADLHYHLRHANIVELLCYNVDPASGPTCMVMELADGSLYDVLHEGRRFPGGDLTLDRRLKILDDVACGLLFLHTHGIMHLDLKSLNLLYDGSGRIKLADFGLSVVRSEIEGEKGGKPAGSLPYMAPELMEDEPPPPTAQCDVYAFYVVCWETVVNKMPHEGKSASWIVRFVATRKKRLEMPKDVFCPDRLDHLMACCAEHDPAQRPTMHVVLLALRDVRSDPYDVNEPSVRKVVDLPDAANFVFEVVDPAGLFATNSARPAKSVTARLEDGALSEEAPGSLLVRRQRRCIDESSSHRETVVVLRTLAAGDEFFVEAHVVAANARDDGEDQVYLKLAGEEAYVGAFADDGQSKVRLVRSNLGAERLARDAAAQGPTAAVAALLFYIAAQREDVMARLLLFASEKLSTAAAASSATTMVVAAPPPASASASATATASSSGGKEGRMPSSPLLSDVVRFKASRRVIAACAVFRDSRSVQRAAMLMIVNLSYDLSEESGSTLEAGLVDTVLVALQTFPADAELRRIAVEAIANLVAKHETAKKLAEGKVVVPLLIAMVRDLGLSATPERPQHRERHLAERVLYALSRIVSADAAAPTVLKQLVDAEAAARVVETCDAALTLANDREASIIIFETRQEAFDVDLILNGGGATSTSGAFSSSSSSSSPEAGRRRPSSATSEEGRSDDGEGCDALALTCCDAIHALATCGRSVEAPMGLCAEPVFRSLEAVFARCLRLREAGRAGHANNLATHGCIAAMALASISGEVRASLADVLLDPLCDLVAAMTAAAPPAGGEAAQTSRLAYYAVGAVHNLCHASPRHSARAIAAGAFGSIARCAARAEGDVEQQRLTCRALAILAVCASQTTFRRDAVLSDDDLAVVPRAMRTFARDVHLQRDACTAIVNLTAFDPSIAAALGRVDTCGAVADALASFPRDARLQECACRAAVHLAHDGGNKVIFDRAHVRDHAITVAATFSATPAVLQWAERLQREL